MRNGTATTPVNYSGLGTFGMVKAEIMKRVSGPDENITVTSEKLNFYAPDMALFSGMDRFRLLSNRPEGDQTMNIVS